MSRILAVAKNTVSQIFRMKIAALFFLLLAIIIPVLGFSITGDGTVKGKVQTFITYGLSLMNLLLCLLTIIISCYCLSFDLKKNILYTVLTKPIRRYELFIGKIIGVLIVDVVFVVIFAAMIYFLTISIPHLSKTTPEEMTKVNNEFFTARAEVYPVPIDIEGVIKKILEEKKSKNQLPHNPVQLQRMTEKLRRALNAQALAVPPAMSRVWSFKGILPTEDVNSIFIHYKFEASSPPSDNMIMGRWTFGDLRPLKLGQSIDPFVVGRKDKNKTVYEVEVPADKVADDGYVDVVYENYPSNKTTVIFDKSEFKLLYKADSFTMNYIRCSLVIFARMIFFAVLGVSLSAWLSFPVAVLISVVIFFIGTMMGFIFDSFRYVEHGVIFFQLVKGIVSLFPRFDGSSNPTQYMLTGTLLSWVNLSVIYVKLVLFKATLTALVGIAVFSKREVAKISV